MTDNRKVAVPEDSREARIQAKAAVEAKARAKALAGAEANTETEAKARAIAAKRRTKNPAAAEGDGEATSRSAGRVSRGNIWALMLVTLVGVVAAVHQFPTFIILACGMPPALVAALVDDKPGRHACRSV